MRGWGCKVHMGWAMKLPLAPSLVRRHLHTCFPSLVPLFALSFTLTVLSFALCALVHPHYAIVRPHYALVHPFALPSLNLTCDCCVRMCTSCTCAYTAYLRVRRPHARTSFTCAYLIHLRVRRSPVPSFALTFHPLTCTLVHRHLQPLFTLPIP